MTSIEGFTRRVFQTAAVALLAIGCASGRFPETSDDGLVKVARTPHGAIYEAPGSEIRAFSELVVEPCTVRFRDNWQRDQNRHRGPTQRVTDEDMNQIAQALAASCRDIFTAELAKVDTGRDEAQGEAGTLTIRPAIVDLDIAAPDVQSPGRQTQYTSTAGSMTLRLELVDSASGAILGRVIDHRRADSTLTLRQTGGASNMAEADRILRRWAELVRELLEAGAD